MELLLVFWLDFLDLVEAAKTLTFLLGGGLLDSLLPGALCDLEGPRDDERSLWCVGGSSSPLSLSVLGSSLLLSPGPTGRLVSSQLRVPGN